MTEFETAYDKYNRDMYRACRRIGTPHARAQDAVQEAARRLSQMSTIVYTDPSRLRGLFCKVAVNCAKTIMTRVINDQKTGVDYAEHQALFETPSLGRKEKETLISITVHRALSQLPELDSYLAWRYYGLQMSLREIAEDLKRDKNIAWDHVRIHRHLRKVVYPALKGALRDLGGESL